MLVIIIPQLFHFLDQSLIPSHFLNQVVHPVVIIFIVKIIPITVQFKIEMLSVLSQSRLQLLIVFKDFYNSWLDSFFMLTNVKIIFIVFIAFFVKFLDKSPIVGELSNDPFHILIFVYELLPSNFF